MTGILTGLISSIVLVLVGPNVMDPLTGWIQMEPLFPLKNPGIVSIPLGFLGAFVGTLLSPKPVSPDRYGQVILQAHTGIKPTGVNPWRSS